MGLAEAEKEEVKVPLPQASAQWRKLRRAQSIRATGLLEELPDAVLPHSDAARRFWSQRAWSEYAAIPAVSQVVLALVREGATLQTLGAYLSIAADEVRHALLSRDLAERLGGYDDVVPEGLGYAPQGLAAPSDVPVAVWALANGCFNETVSLELIRARCAATKQPLVRRVLAETLKDEAVHVRVAWQLAEEVLPRLPGSQRRELWDYGEELAQMTRRTFGTQGLPAAIQRRERKLRADTAKQGLGALAPDEENAIVEAALAAIARRLGKLGIRAGRR